MLSSFFIRPERPEDVPSIRSLSEQAFGRPDEARLIDALRATCEPFLSLVACDGDLVIGHILFTPVSIRRSGNTVAGMGLAPMAVLPARQRRGVGSALVEHGLSALRDRKCPFAVVLGHIGYYPRFGFQPAARFNLQCQWPGIPSGAFMILVFDHRVLDGASGVVYYCKEFSDLL